MKRITEMEICGKKYPLNFSVNTTIALAERCGGIDHLWEYLEKKPIEEQLNEIVWILSRMIQQGVAYLKITEGKDMDALTEEELRVLIGPFDLNRSYNAISGAMVAGSEQEIEVDPPKNAEATQAP